MTLRVLSYAELQAERDALRAALRDLYPLALAWSGYYAGEYNNGKVADVHGMYLSAAHKLLEAGK